GLRTRHIPPRRYLAPAPAAAHRPFLALFGPVTWAAKLPNLLLLLGLAWAVFAAASRLWDGRIGLLAGLLTLLHPYFFNSVLYPINDLAFTLIFFALAWLVWEGIIGGPPQTPGRETPAPLAGGEGMIGGHPQTPGR